MKKHLIPRRKKEKGVYRWDDANPFEGLHRQMNELFDDFCEGFGSSPLMGLRGPEERWATLSPSVEVADAGDVIQVVVELPGMSEREIDISLDRNMLTIKGEKKQEHEETKKDYYFSECSYGQFQRNVPLPDDVDESNVKATFKKGVLKVSLPKVEQAVAKSKRIDIRAD